MTTSKSIVGKQRNERHTGQKIPSRTTRQSSTKAQAMAVHKAKDNSWQRFEHHQSTAENRSSTSRQVSLARSGRHAADIARLNQQLKTKKSERDQAAAQLDKAAANLKAKEADVHKLETQLWQLKLKQSKER